MGNAISNGSPDDGPNEEETDDSYDSEHEEDNEYNTEADYSNNLDPEKETTFCLINGICVMNAFVHDIDENDESNQCIICLERRKIVATVPCGHVATCMKCAIDYYNNDSNSTCIVCSEEIDTLIGLYF
jgi:hypothetical protein